MIKIPERKLSKASHKKYKYKIHNVKRVRAKHRWNNFKKDSNLKRIRQYF